MIREFDYESLSLEDRESIHGALAETTLKHIAGSDGLFSELDLDLVKNPSQRLEITHLHPQPTDRTEVATLADIASKNLSPFIRESLQKQLTAISAIRQLLRQGVNVFPVTTHQKIQDVAIWGANLSDCLEEEHWQDQMGHVISRGVTTIGAFGMAASEVLQKDGHVFMSFPRTPTIEDLGFDEKLVKTNNKNMRKEIHTWLGQDLIHKVKRNRLGRALNIAWSGKTDKIEYGDNHQPTSIMLGRVGLGTLDIVKRGVVLPIVLWDGDDPVFEMGEITEVESLDDVVGLQKWQAETLADRLGLPHSAVTVESI